MSEYGEQHSVIVFQQLANEQVRSIIGNLTRNLRAVAKENGFELDITEAVKDFLIEQGAGPMRTHTFPSQCCCN